MNEARAKRAATYPLRLPASIKREAERLAAEDGASFNQFVASAVAEKVGAMRTASFFAERRNRADFSAFDRLMARSGGEPPREDDIIPVGRIVSTTFDLNESGPDRLPIQAANGDIFRERTIELTETGEEALVGKTARLVEEVGLRADVGERVEVVRDTIRDAKVRTS